MLIWRPEKLVLKNSHFDCSKIAFLKIAHLECSNLGFSLSTALGILLNVLNLEHFEGAAKILIMSGKPTTSVLCTDLGFFEILSLYSI